MPSRRVASPTGPLSAALTIIRAQGELLGCRMAAPQAFQFGSLLGTRGDRSSMAGHGVFLALRISASESQSPPEVPNGPR